MTTTLYLCDEKGNLNPTALGFRKTPAICSNVQGRWLRKKKWNHWLIASEQCVLAFTICDFDYIGAAFLKYVDLASGEHESTMTKVPLGLGVRLGEQTDDPAVFTTPTMTFRFAEHEGSTSIRGEGRTASGKSFELHLVIENVAESINVVIPWSPKLFHFTSKQNGRRVSGHFQIGEKHYAFGTGDSWALASFDFGRGVWPYASGWNWASCSFLHNGQPMGFNFGAGWTDGTGINENGYTINGNVYKLEDEVRFLFQPEDKSAPWRMESVHSEQVRLRFTPLVVFDKNENYLIIKSKLDQVIGLFDGEIRAADGEVYRIANAAGICEDHRMRW